MLSKDICKRCIGEKFPKNPWNSADDEYRWEEGKVFCIVYLKRETTKGESSRYWVFIDGEPPKDCPYFLEQMLYSMSKENQGKKDAK